MPRYRILMKTTAFATVDVDADDLESAIEAAINEAPAICARCGGWGRDDFSLDLDGEWEIEDEYYVDGEFVEVDR